MSSVETFVGWALVSYLERRVVSDKAAELDRAKSQEM